MKPPDFAFNLILAIFWFVITWIIGFKSSLLMNDNPFTRSEVGNKVKWMVNFIAPLVFAVLLVALWSWLSMVTIVSKCLMPKLVLFPSLGMRELVQLILTVHLLFVFWIVILPLLRQLHLFSWCQICGTSVFQFGVQMVVSTSLISILTCNLVESVWILVDTCMFPVSLHLWLRSLIHASIINVYKL